MRREIKTTKYGQFTMNSNAMFAYVKKVGLTEAKTKSEFDNLFTTVDGVSTIISVLDSIKLIPEGGERKIDVEGSFFDKTVTRPLSITNDNIDILRSKLLAYQTLLIEDQQ